MPKLRVVFSYSHAPLITKLLRLVSVTQPCSERKLAGTPPSNRTLKLEPNPAGWNSVMAGGTDCFILRFLSMKKISNIAR